MFGHDFDNRVIRKYVILFGTLFNDLHVMRRDNNNNLIQKIKVPLAYAPQEKVLARLNQDPSLDRQVAITLPRLSFEMSGLNYAPDRKLSTLNQLAKVDSFSKAKVAKSYMPVPYDFNFQLHFYVKYAEDATQILEQIVPFFTPEWTSTVNLIPDLGLKVDIPVVLQGTSIQDLYEGDFEQRRALIYTLDFVLKGYVFGPVHKAGIIKTVKSKIISQDENAVFTQNNHLSVQTSTYTINTAASNTSSNTADAALITSTPGLLANGSPTSNASVSVGIDNIDADDDFGVIHDIEEYFNDST